ncbi:MAG TPA: 16S rRNA (cytosine(967)-C(5))-methyltransferase RsmB [Longimicrobiales bacterium]|nr:16S rRNA (cytosine(967)-C(5))-methyltransferase RsmB [Longimicrobiales bacterium]
MSATAARRAALEVLRAVRRGDLADRALVRAQQALEARDRALVHELVFGTLRLQGRIDHALGAFSSRPLADLDADVRDALRLGAYQLLELGGVPPYAAVSETVELLKGAAPRAAGFANAVLQALHRGREALTFPALADDPLAHLATWGSHPEWLVARWLGNFGPAETAALVAADNERPELFLRLLRDDATTGLVTLATHGVAAVASPLDPQLVRLERAVDALAALRALPAVVQDPAAALVVRYATVPSDAVVADLCAAPGGKAIGLATGAHYMAAADLSPRRLRRVRENLERLAGQGMELPLGLLVADGRAPALRPVDAVLLDAPCTGTGTLRRHPDGRWRIGPRDLAALTALQRELLAAAAPLVRPGGLLIYATCSLEPEENEDQVASFLDGAPEFSIEMPAVELPGLIDARGMLRVLPQRHGCDGAFAARLRRRLR